MLFWDDENFWTFETAKDLEKKWQWIFYSSISCILISCWIILLFRTKFALSLTILEITHLVISSTKISLLSLTRNSQTSKTPLSAHIYRSLSIAEWRWSWVRCSFFYCRIPENDLITIFQSTAAEAMARNELMVNERAKEEMEKITENLMNPRECYAASADQIGNDVWGREGKVDFYFICREWARQRREKLSYFSKINDKTHLKFLFCLHVIYFCIFIGSRKEFTFKICVFVEDTTRKWKENRSSKISILIKHFKAN